MKETLEKQKLQLNQRWDAEALKSQLKIKLHFRPTASFLATTTARQLVCWDKLSPSTSPWYPFCLATAAASCLTAGDKLCGTGTVLPISIPPNTRTFVILVRLWQGCEQTVQMKKPTKAEDNPAWVPSWNCPISRLCYPLTDRSQGTDTEIRSHR